MLFTLSPPVRVARLVRPPTRAASGINALVRAAPTPLTAPVPAGPPSAGPNSVGRPPARAADFAKTYLASVLRGSGNPWTVLSGLAFARG